MPGASARSLPDGRIAYDPRGAVNAEARPLAPRPAAFGAERLEPVVIAHPLSTLTADEIVARAAEAAVGGRRILTAREPGPEL